MRAVEVTDETYRQIQWLAANTYVIKGKKPAPMSKVVGELVKKDYSFWDHAYHQTTGFDRQ